MSSISSFRLIACLCLLYAVEEGEWTSCTYPAAQIASWYWKIHKIAVPADADDMVAVTRKISGGTNALEYLQ